MPNKRTNDAQRLAQNKASIKYRRKQTLINKVRELAKLADLNVNLLIEDKQFNKIF